MAEAFYPPRPATDGTLAPVPGAVFQVFELADTNYSTPLSLRVGDGNPQTSLTATESLATLPGVYVTSSNFSHNFVSGDFVWRRDSFDQAQKATEEARAAAEAVANRAANGEFKGAKGDQGAPGRDGSNVLPTDQAVADAITTPGSAPYELLDATYGAGAVMNPETDLANAIGQVVDDKLAVFQPDQVPIVVNHGGNAAFTRPNWAGPVIWQGTVIPTNVVAGDSYYLVAVEPVPWTPMEIPSLLAWYDPTAAILSGSNVTSWPDLSGDGRNATVVTGTPTFSATGLNGTPGVVGNGSSRLATDLFASALTGPITVFFAGQSTTGTASFLDGGADNQLSVSRTTGTGYRMDRGAGFSSTAPDDGNPHVFCNVFNGASSEFYMDGVLAGTGGTVGASDDVTKFSLLGRAVATNRYITGALGDVFYMAGVPTPAVRAAAIEWLSERSGIAVTV